ncbi:MAG: peptidase domain-containing ABC transporter [Bacteroidales bacterium]|nr:peptidase domain-containing ABC transporter [Bacteroidales bacterium]
MKSFPFFYQHDSMDCGPTCLRMIAMHYGKHYSLETLRKRSEFSRLGVSMLGISQAAESIGFRSTGVKITFEDLKESTLPCIIHWNQNHFMVVHGFKGRGKRLKVLVADPSAGLNQFSEREFRNGWISTISRGKELGAALILEPTPEFRLAPGESINRNKFRFLLSYVKPYKQLISQLIIGLVAGSLLQLILPFLTQSIVDIGIGTQNIKFIWLVLIAQLALTLGMVFVEFIRGWILLHLGTRVNISLISDFLIKLMKLPIGFFDTKTTGDLLQRISDHKRIQNFLTGSSLNILFSMMNIVVFGAVLLFYNFTIFAVFFGASALYILWVNLFMKKRRELDHRTFAQNAANQSSLIQLITGMQEIKLNSCEKQKRWEWERIQAKLFNLGLKGLALGQYQEAGGTLINQLKNIIVTFIAANAVISGDLTLGMMLSVQYIIGQLNSPVNLIIGFIQQTQDARISLERLSEIHTKKDEDDPSTPLISEIPKECGIRITDLSFKYDGAGSPTVLNSINLEIPHGKTTAIVGASGSGKTTLIKLMLGFYQPLMGKIEIGSTALTSFSMKEWRRTCGVVMQEGFIFSDTIANNIAPGDEYIDKEGLQRAVSIANIGSFIENLPLNYNTKIGQEGFGTSQGQKQRILIARAVYKNPQFLFFDEATNALDANNEKVIMENLAEFFKGRTVVVVAHRLSTVRNADNIIVLDRGRIIEQGTHHELTEKRGEYYRLVKNQLELGN